MKIRKIQYLNSKWFGKLTISSSLNLRAEGLSNAEGQITSAKPQNFKRFEFRICNLEIVSDLEFCA